MKPLGFNFLKVKCFKAVGFGCQPAPLHRGSVTELLLAAGLPVDTTDDVGRTPLYVAAAAGAGEVAGVLIEAGGGASSTLT